MNSNQDVQLVTNDDDEEDAASEPKIPIKSCHPKPCPATANKVPTSAPKGNKASGSTAVSKVTKKKALPAESSELEPRGLTANHVHNSNLPEFLEKKSKKKFIPTIVDALFASGRPWGNFGNDDVVVQEVLNLVCLEANYTMKDGSPITLLAYNQINEKHGLVARETYEFFKYVDGFGSVNEVEVFCQWAMRPDGPIFFKTPTPATCTRNKDDPAYIRPQGCLESDFVISVAKKCLQFSKNSVADFGHPKGLFTLILAAYEQAIKSYINGQQTDLDPFSFELNGSQTIGYVHGLEGISDERWARILGLCKPAEHCPQASDISQSGDMSLLDQNRATLFDLSSPTKGP
ncbi:hypothetical protein C8J56DRAFT_890016 [Mycena floridula]|nr:hypothetical protein C8J56DRAFT_890016 [Mycena floridula]